MSNTQRCAILQRDAESYAIIPRTPCGMVTVENLEAIAGVCRKYNVPVVKITSGMRLALVGVKSEDLDAIWSDLNIDSAEAHSPAFHYSQACPGTAVCSKVMRTVKI